MALRNTDIEKRLRRLPLVGLSGVALTALLASAAPSPASASHDEVGKISEDEAGIDIGPSCPMLTMLEMGASDPPDSCPLC